jgi:hypothetical protein
MLHPLSFLLGLGAAWAVPVIARTFRPVAVQVAAVGMGMVDEARRVLAEQMETLEDIAAEARSRREEMLAAESNGAGDAMSDEAEDRPARARRPAARRPRAERPA